MKKHYEIIRSNDTEYIGKLLKFENGTEWDFEITDSEIEDTEHGLFIYGFGHVDTYIQLEEVEVFNTMDQLKEYISNNYYLLDRPIEISEIDLSEYPVHKIQGKYILKDND